MKCFSILLYYVSPVSRQSETFFLNPAQQVPKVNHPRTHSVAKGKLYSPVQSVAKAKVYSRIQSVAKMKLYSRVQSVAELKFYSRVQSVAKAKLYSQVKSVAKAKEDWNLFPQCFALQLYYQFCISRDQFIPLLILWRSCHKWRRHFPRKSLFTSITLTFGHWRRRIWMIFDVSS